MGSAKVGLACRESVAASASVSMGEPSAEEYGGPRGGRGAEGGKGGNVTAAGCRCEWAARCGLCGLGFCAGRSAASLPLGARARVVPAGFAGGGCCGWRIGESGSQTGRGGVAERGGACPGWGLKEDSLMVMCAGAPGWVGGGRRFGGAVSSQWSRRRWDYGAGAL